MPYDTRNLSAEATALYDSIEALYKEFVQGKYTVPEGHTQIDLHRSLAFLLRSSRGLKENLTLTSSRQNVGQLTFLMLRDQVHNTSVSFKRVQDILIPKRTPIWDMDCL